MERWVILCVALTIAAGCEGSEYQEITENLNKKLSTALPLPDDGSPVKVDVAWQVLSIDDVDKANNRVGLVVSKRASWTDLELAWDADTVGGVTSLFVDPTNIWKPDIAVFSAPVAEKAIYPEAVLVMSDGLLISSSSAKIYAMCDVSSADSYSGATCEFALGSWAFRNSLVSLDDPSDYSFFTGSFSSSSKYEILTYNVKKMQRNYACCKYETKFTHDIWVINFSFREKASSSKKSKLSMLKSLLKD